jgi:hypothetical protein
MDVPYRMTHDTVSVRVEMCVPSITLLCSFLIDGSQVIHFAAACRHHAHIILLCSM